MKKIVLTLNYLMIIAQVSVEGQTLDKIVDSFRTTYNVPAIAVSVIQYDTIYYGISGHKNIESKNPIDLESKFHLASNTKAITATIAAKMVEDGKLTWESKLVEIVPELEKIIRDDYRNITLQDLLSNRAKVQPFEDDRSKEWRNMPKSIRKFVDQKLEFAKYALSIKPAISKDKNHSYSNGGFIIAGLMMERQSGKSWDAITKEFFNKQHLDIYNGFPSQENIKGTRGHKKKGKSYKPVDPNDVYPLDNYFAPAGNASMSILDISKFTQFHLRGLMGDSNFLSSATYQKLHFGLSDYALGWYNGNIGNTKEKFSYHGGSLGTFSTAIMLSADRKVAIVILINADDKNITELKNELRKILWRKYGSSKS